jgi:hypothetical protein
MCVMHACFYLCGSNLKMLHAFSHGRFYDEAQSVRLQVALELLRFSQQGHLQMGWMTDHAMTQSTTTGNECYVDIEDTLRTHRLAQLEQILARFGTNLDHRRDATKFFAHNARAFELLCT